MSHQMYLRTAAMHGRVKFFNHTHSTCCLTHVPFLFTILLSAAKGYSPDTPHPSTYLEKSSLDIDPFSTSWPHKWHDTTTKLSLIQIVTVADRFQLRVLFMLVGVSTSKTFWWISDNNLVIFTTLAALHGRFELALCKFECWYFKA